MFSPFLARYWENINTVHILIWQEPRTCVSTYDIKVLKRKFSNLNNYGHLECVTIQLQYLNSVFAGNGKIMQWLACSPNSRKSLEHPQEEGLLLWQTVHGQKGPLGRHSDCFQRYFIGWYKILTSSMDQRLFSLIYNNGGYIKY